MGVSGKQSTSNFPKNEHFLPSDAHTYVWVSVGKKCLFFGKFCVLCFLETPVLRCSLLPYYRRVSLWCRSPTSYILFNKNNATTIKSKKILTKILLLGRRFGRISSVYFQASTMKKLRYKYYNKPITTRDNDNVQSYDQEESKFNGTINADSGAHTLSHEKMSIQYE